MKLVKSRVNETDILVDNLTSTQIKILNYFIQEHRITEIASILNISVSEIERLLGTLKMAWGFRSEVGLTIHIIRRGYHDESGIMKYAILSQCIDKLMISEGLKNSLKKFLSTVDQETFTVGELTLDVFLQIKGAGFGRYAEFNEALRSLSAEVKQYGT